MVVCAYVEGSCLLGVKVGAVLDGVVGGLPVRLLPLSLVGQEVVPGQRIERRPMHRTMRKDCHRNGDTVNTGWGHLTTSN